MLKPQSAALRCYAYPFKRLETVKSEISHITNGTRNIETQEGPAYQSNFCFVRSLYVVRISEKEDIEKIVNKNNCIKKHR